MAPAGGGRVVRRDALGEDEVAAGPGTGTVPGIHLGEDDPDRGAADGGSGFRAEFVEVGDEEVLVVHGRGELDLANRHEIRTAVAEAHRARRRRAPAPTSPLARLVVDLGAATYLGATTIAALAEEAGRTAARRTPRLVVGRGGVVGRVAAMLDLAEIFDVYDDLVDALAPDPPRHRG